LAQVGPVWQNAFRPHLPTMSCAQPRDMPPMAFPPMDGAAVPRDMPGLPFPFPGGENSGFAEAGDREWPEFPPMGAGGFGGARATRGGDSPPGGNLGPPKLPAASPVANIACPLGQAIDPSLTTPQWAPAGRGGGSGFGFASGSSPTPGKTVIGGLSGIDQWAWEMGSDAGSMPSAWSKATSSKTGASRMSSASGVDGLIPGLVDGQRLSAVRPSSLPQRGGKVIVSLRKEVPQGFWDTVSIVLVNLPVSLNLKPTGIKKGKKLCIEVPAGMKPDDYDVRLKFGEKIIHGSIPLSIRDDDDEGICDMEEDDLKDLASDFKALTK